MTAGNDNGWRKWAYVGLIFGAAGSVTANVGHAFMKPAGAEPDWHWSGWALGWGIAVAVALLVAVEVLARAPWPDTAGWRTVRYGGGGLVGTVAAGTSYRHLSDVLKHSGEWGPIVYGGPAIVDGLMLLCSFALMIPDSTSAPQPVGVHSGAGVQSASASEVHSDSTPAGALGPPSPGPSAPELLAADARSAVHSQVQSAGERPGAAGDGEDPRLAELRATYVAASPLPKLPSARQLCKELSIGQRRASKIIKALESERESVSRSNAIPPAPRTYQDQPPEDHLQHTPMQLVDDGQSSASKDEARC